MIADILLGIFICGVFICGKLSATEQSQLWEHDRTQEVSDLQVSKDQNNVVWEEDVLNGSDTQGRVLQDKEEASVGENKKSEPAIIESKKIALTFDDGPDPDYTPQLLEGLRERGVQATFFLLGKQIALNPEIVEEMYADGHEIGIHAWEHVNLNALSEAEACEQIQSTGDLICDLTGEWPAFVRPPYGNWPSALDDDFCLITVLWDIDPLDWATGDASVVVQRITETVEEYDVILLHDASESSVQAALQVVDQLSQEGYEFVTVEELIFP